MIDQDQLLEDVKKLLKDLDHFFSVTLKKEKLKKDATAEKDQLYSALKETLAKLDGDEEIQEEYDDVSSYQQSSGQQEEDDSGMLYDETSVEAPKPFLPPPPDSISHTGSQKSSENDDDNDEDRGDINYDGTKIRPKSVSELGVTSKEGLLDKKRKDGQFGFSNWQTRYCIIKDNIMYYYKSKLDTKQCNEINLSGYEATPAPDVEKKHKRKQFLFIISQPGCRSFQFIAQSSDDVKSWVEAINQASKIQPKPDPVQTSAGDSVSMASGDGQDFGEEYEDLDEYQKFKMGQGVNSSEDKNSPKIEEEEKDFGDEYEDLDEYQKLKMGQKAPLPPPPSKDVPSFQPTQEADDFGDEYEDLDDYQKMKIGMLPKKEETSNDFGETYDDVSVTSKPSPVSVRHTPLPPPPVDSPKLPARDLRPLPRDLPPPPLEEKNSNGVDNPEPWEKDFENIYVGMWDCKAEEDDELEFKRGDLIHILSREYNGWWIGEKNYMVGLVPKEYLMEAYLQG